MNLLEFDVLTRNIVSPLLEKEYGFVFADGTFVRDLPGQVRHVVMFDFDVRKAKTFRVVMGFNSPLICGDAPPNEAGVFGVRYLGESNLSEMPSNFPCFNKESANKSLERAKHCLHEKGIPWMDSLRSLKAIAQIAEEQYPFIKGKLYFSAGDFHKAKIYLLKHLSYLSAQPKTAEAVQGIEDTQEMLKHCASVASAGWVERSETHRHNFQ
ncbi:MAG: hypothetical protein LBE81_10685 [Azonexus sp.]|jgi:hypothetical protein|uniref:hypothetical protein n=1 Tax=Azonexus sp. TaxID=1872668 RepID=UPI002819E58D|nr:hypothetical protein [Azonexus sp.]MDR0777083.1 hypothetical protein [Azonexus sp.]